MQSSHSAAPAAGPRANLRPALTRIAWWSILLGLLMQALLLVIRFNQPTQPPLLAEGLGKVTWSLLVCMGLGIGKLLSEGKPFWMGFAGLVGAPLAFTAAQAIQKTVTELTTSVEAGPITQTQIVTGALRGVEYMILGAVLAVLAQRKARPARYLTAGLIVGLVFGLIVLLLTPAARASVAALLAWAVNELLFPMGCAAVLYGAGVVGKAVSQT